MPFSFFVYDPSPPQCYFVCLFVCLFIFLFVCLFVLSLHFPGNASHVSTASRMPRSRAKRPRGGKRERLRWRHDRTRGKEGQRHKVGDTHIHSVNTEMWAKRIGERNK